MDTHLIRGSCSRHAGLSALLPLVLLSQCWAQATKDEAPLALSCTSTKDMIQWGQPLFVEVVLRNQGEQPQRLRDLAKGDGLSKLTWRVSGLRGIIWDDCRVPFRDAEKLDSLLRVANLRDSPCAKYVKWQRVRSYLTDGVAADGNDALESVSSREKTASALLEVCEDLVDSVGRDEPPILRDALTARGIALAFLGKTAAAREVCDKLEAAFARTDGMVRLREWFE